MTSAAVTAKETFRDAIFREWNSKLRALDFRGGKSSRMHRVLPEVGVFQVLELQWSRFNADDDARVRVHAGVGHIAGIPPEEKPHLDHCFLTYAPMQSRDASDNWIRFLEGDSEDALTQLLRRDYREAWLPFFEQTARPHVAYPRDISVRDWLKASRHLRLV